MRVPADAVVDAGSVVQGHLDEGHAALDEPAGQQAALAKEVTTIAVAQLLRFAIKVEGFHRLGAHHGDGALVGGVVAERSRPRALGEEVLFKVVDQLQPGPGLAVIDAGRQVEVLNLEGFLIVGGLTAPEGEVQRLFADDEWGKLRPEEAGRRRRRG